MSGKKNERLDTANEKAARAAEKARKELEKAEDEAKKAARIESAMREAGLRYIRVGDDYLEKGFEVDFHERETPVWLKRKKETIIDDYGRECLGGITKYFTNCYVPSHTNYKPVVRNNFNLYHSVSATAKKMPIPTWETLIHHIGGDQYEMLWDYVQLLWEKPTQALPVLCLVSKENNTGKSTFGNALTYLFEYNVRFYNQTDLNSQFNGWAQNLVAVFEEISDTSRAVNIIKAISTAQSLTINRKFQQPFSFKPFVKVVVNSNNNTGFIKADSNDQRYWVINVPVFPTENFSATFLDDLQAEVPGVVDFLNKRTLSVPEKMSRMWFSFDQIKTDALAVIIKESRDDLQKDIELLLEDKLGEMGKDLYITSAMIKEWLGAYSTSYSKINAAMNALGYARKTGRYTDHLGFERNQSHYHVPFVPAESAEEPNLPFDEQSVEDDEDNKLPF